ncbi:alpha/beta hydrolase [Pseudonocardiaceae bacterium YIM PH 21723]|nr:alpha/beta hydrolase [Pseudonocardiaceae bacterium YIM PH 21723]
MAPTAKELLHELSRPGQHEVLRGDLGLVGLPGAVFTPQSGRSLPAVAFGHGWLQPAERYYYLLRHWASWGIVAAAPDTQRGPLQSHRLLAADLRTTLDILSGVPLGDGKISVHPERMGLAGHSTGGGCAVLAASQDERARGVVTLASAETLPSALDASNDCTMPAMHLYGGEDRVAPAVGHSEPLANAWAGAVQLRGIPAASHLGFTEGSHWSTLLIDGKPERKTARLVKALSTAFLLRVLTGTRAYDELLAADNPPKGTTLDLARPALAVR